MNARDKLTKARTGLILDAPFFGSLALKLVAKEDASCPTAYTDGRVMGYNPAYVDKLSLNQAKGLWAHEVWHCAGQHHVRRGGRDPEKWNIAADYVTDAVLVASGMEVPDAMLNPAFDGMSAEAVYPRIPDQPQGGGGQGHGCGEVRDAVGDDGKPAGEAEAQRQAADWKVSVAQAAAQARAMGNMPATLDRLVAEIVAAKVDWRETLRRFVQQAAKSDYRWTPPNRRHVHAGVYLPSLGGETVGEIVVAVDTSGSIGAEELRQFGGEINSILEEYDTVCHVVYCDASVQAVETFGRDDLPLVLRAKGGGGTDFRPVFTWAMMQAFTPACIVYLTDMMGTFPEAAPTWPTLWVSTSAVGEAPFGEVVKM